MSLRVYDISLYLSPIIFGVDVSYSHAPEFREEPRLGRCHQL
nr:MAG TPA: hypothetical protein [Caudoviricetes sp.]